VYFPNNNDLGSIQTLRVCIIRDFYYTLTMFSFQCFVDVSCYWILRKFPHCQLFQSYLDKRETISKVQALYTNLVPMSTGGGSHNELLSKYNKVLLCI